MAPTFRQAEEIAWQYFLDYTQHLPHVKINKTKLKIMIERPWRVHPVTGEPEPDTVTIALIGGHNYDGIRGWYLDGGVLDEFAQCDPQIYSKVIRPAWLIEERKRKSWGYPWILEADPLSRGLFSLVHQTDRITFSIVSDRRKCMRPNQVRIERNMM